MKRILYILLTILVCIQFCACSNSSNSVDSSTATSSAVTQQESLSESTIPETTLSSPANYNDMVAGVWTDGFYLYHFSDREIDELENHLSGYGSFDSFSTYCIDGSYHVTPTEEASFEVQLDGWYLWMEQHFSYTLEYYDDVLALDGDPFLTRISYGDSPVGSIVGCWKPFGQDSFSIHGNYKMISGTSISFYQDGTFNTSNSDYGEYSIIFDGEALTLQTDPLYTYGPYEIYIIDDTILIIEIDDKGYLFCRAD